MNNILPIKHQHVNIVIISATVPTSSKSPHSGDSQSCFFNPYFWYSKSHFSFQNCLFDPSGVAASCKLIMSRGRWVRALNSGGSTGRRRVDIKSQETGPTARGGKKRRKCSFGIICTLCYLSVVWPYIILKVSEGSVYDSAGSCRRHTEHSFFQCVTNTTYHNRQACSWESVTTVVVVVQWPRGSKHKDITQNRTIFQRTFCEML